MFGSAYVTSLPANAIDDWYENTELAQHSLLGAEMACFDWQRNEMYSLKIASHDRTNKLKGLIHSRSTIATFSVASYLAIK